VAGGALSIVGVLRREIVTLSGSEPPMRRFAVSLGSNLGDRLANLAFGVRRVRDVAERLVASSVYETRARYVEEQPDFLNACCVGCTRLTPRQLLAHLQDSERAAGRRRGGLRYGPRTLDLDLLLYGSDLIELPGLTVPHPKLGERAFVLVPLAEIAGDWVVPAREGKEGRTVQSLAAEAGSEGIRRWGEVGTG
jgi:2-amino-4-hydroxy-6-hydroxymethyldihydropteridine diphosphokinase